MLKGPVTSRGPAGHSFATNFIHFGTKIANTRATASNEDFPMRSGILTYPVNIVCSGRARAPAH